MFSIDHIVMTAITVVLLVFSAMIHEVAHGFVAHLCGDDTAKEAGRLTLNPAKHLDPFGSIALPIIMGALGGFVFSYAKPVPYNPYRLKNRRRDEVLVALAGPASNLLQAVVGALVFNGLWAIVEANPALYYGGPTVLGMTAMQFALTLFSTYVWVNLMLCAFNLIPLPPLDGSKVVCFFLKGAALERYYQIQHYAMPILIFALYILPRVGFDPVGAYLDAAVGGLYNLLLGM